MVVMNKSISYNGVNIPSKYVSGLSGSTRRKRLAAIAKARKSGEPMPRSLPGDDKTKTRRSRFTRKFNKRYGNS